MFLWTVLLHEAHSQRPFASICESMFLLNASRTAFVSPRCWSGLMLLLLSFPSRSHQQRIPTTRRNSCRSNLLVLTPMPQCQDYCLHSVGPSPRQKVSCGPRRYHILCYKDPIAIASVCKRHDTVWINLETGDHKGTPWATIARTDGTRAQSVRTISDHRRKFVEVGVLLTKLLREKSLQAEDKRK